MKKSSKTLFSWGMAGMPGDNCRGNHPTTSIDGNIEYYLESRQRPEGTEREGRSLEATRTPDYEEE